MERLDPKSVWLFFIRSIWQVVIRFGLVILAVWYVVSKPYLRDTEAAQFYNSGSWDNWWVYLIIFLALAYIWAQLTYHYYRYELKEDGFRKERGVIWKKYVTIPYDRIQNVDIHRDLWSRFLGLSDLRIETAGSSVANAEAGLPGLPKEVAEQLRDELIKRARQSRDQGL